MRVLFVDDDAFLLKALARAIRNKAREWDVSFANSGKEAIALFEQEPFDVIVSDMMMPEMSGEQLLDYISKEYPLTARVVLSGQCSQEKAFRLVGSKHLYLSKPCPADLLVQTIKDAKELVDHLAHHTATLTFEELEDSISHFLTELMLEGKISKQEVPINLRYLLSRRLLESYGPALSQEEAFNGSVDDEVSEYLDWTNSSY